MRKIFSFLSRALVALSLLSILNFQLSIAFAQGTAFTYQGQLNDGGSPGNNSYDLRFALFDAVTNGNAVGFPQTNSAVPVSNGLFTTILDFGSGIFTGTNYWLQIGVRTNGDTNAFALLFPRQPVLPAPYAIFANTASNLLGTLSATQLSGTLPASAFAGYTNTVALTNGANTFAGSFGGIFNGAFNGNGGGLTNVNVTNLTGVLADSQLPANTAFVNSNQTFSGANNFTNFGNSFVGSFFGNGLVGWVVTNGTAIQAEIDHGYVLTNSQLMTVTLPVSPSAGDIVRISGAGAGGWKIMQNAGQSVLGNFSSFTSSLWTLVETADNWEGIASSSDGSRLLAGTDSQGIFASVNSGATWTSSTSPENGAQDVACSADGTKCVAVLSGGSGAIYTSTNSGGTWMKQTSGLPASANWYSVASSADGGRLVAVVFGGKIYTSSNSGNSWAVQTGSPGNLSWYSVASSASGSNLVAVINGGGIYTNSGTSWFQTGAPATNWDSVASSADGGRLVAAVFGGGIYVSANFGGTWTRTGAPGTNWAAVASSADGGKLAAAVLNGGIYISSNFGTTWTPQTNAPVEKWISIASSADGGRLAATVHNLGGGLYISQASVQTATTPGINGYISGGQGTAIELQYIGNGQFMPVSSFGSIWAY